MLIALVAMTLGAVAQAQIPPNGNPPVHFTVVNALNNPGFESGTPYWDTSGSYYINSEGDLTHPSIDKITTQSHHSGSRGLNMHVSDTGFGDYTFADLRQTLSTPLPTSACWDASLWAKSYGQTLFLAIIYTDGTASQSQFYVWSGDAKPADNGWVKWDFRSILKSGKTIKQIDISTESQSGSDVVLDDISLSYLKIIP